MALIVLVLGAAGSGKTTFISNVVRTFGSTFKVAVVYNDDGQPGAVDLPSDLGKYADITSMTSGCFGCADAGAFLERIEALRALVDVVLVEPIGFVDAEEMLSTLRRINISPKVIAIVDAEHHLLNVQFGTTEGHVRAADLVLVSKLGEEDRNDVIRWAEERCPNVLPFSITDAVDVRSVAKRRRFTVNHGHHHNHFHLATFHLRLNPNVTAESVRAVLNDFPAVIRAKGDACGDHFDLVQGTWSKNAGGGSVPYITFYTAPDRKRDGEACLTALVPYSADGWVGLTGTAAATRGEVVSLEAVKYQFELCEKMPLTHSSGHPVPNPEWQELLNELRKRPGVPEELQTACVRTRVAHYLRCARWYVEHPDRENDAVATTRLHAIAVGVGWFVSEMSRRLDPKMIEEAKSYPIARWLAIGLSGRTRPNIDSDKEVTIADEALVTALWAVSLGQGSDQLRGAWEHNLRLVESSQGEVVEAWAQSYAQLTS